MSALAPARTSAPRLMLAGGGTGGHVYPGWRQRWRYETHSERLTVRRVPRYSAGDGSLRGRMAGHLSFEKRLSRRELRPADIVFFSTAPNGRRTLASTVFHTGTTIDRAPQGVAPPAAEHQLQLELVS